MISAKTAQKARIFSRDLITDKTIKKAGRIIEQTEIEMKTRSLHKFPDNTEPNNVAIKIRLVDIIDSIHLSQHKKQHS